MSPNSRSLGTQALWSALCQSAAAMAVVKITAADPAARRLGSVMESYIPSPHLTAVSLFILLAIIVQPICAVATQPD